jgi:polysaccharide export outer membrane protein
LLPRIVAALCALAGGAASGRGADSAAPTNPEYVLTVGDTVAVNVSGEPDLRAAEVIDRDGKVRLSLVGELKLGGLSVRAAEQFIAQSYREGQFLRSPDVAVQVSDYAPRFVTVLGAVRSVGKIPFPRDRKQMELVDVISAAGGFTPVAKGDAVVLTRTSEQGAETSQTVDVSALMSGKRRDDKAAPAMVQPGDRVFVPERLF